MDVHWCVEVMRSMKKPSSTPFLIWVMVITLHAHLSIAAASNSNESTSLCDGSLKDCLMVHQLDSQFPTITTRMLAQMDHVTSDLTNANKPGGCGGGNGYRHCPELQINPGIKHPETCSYYKRIACWVMKDCDLVGHAIYVFWCLGFFPPLL